MAGAGAHDRTQDSSVSHIMDFLSSDFQICSHKGSVAPEPAAEQRGAVALVAVASLSGNGFPRKHQRMKILVQCTMDNDLPPKIRQRWSMHA